MNDPFHKQRLTATIFYLKTQHRWRETSDVQTTTVNLPGIPTFKEVTFDKDGEPDNV
jgi:hypothetical protein